MTIHIFDSEGTELELGDVIIIQYRNPKILHIGVLAFRPSIGDLVLAGWDTDWISFPQVHGKSERFCKFTDRPELDMKLGRHQFKSIKEVAKFLENL